MSETQGQKGWGVVPLALEMLLATNTMCIQPGRSIYWITRGKSTRSAPQSADSTESSSSSIHPPPAAAHSRRTFNSKFDVFYVLKLNSGTSFCWNANWKAAALAQRERELNGRARCFLSSTAAFKWRICDFRAHKRRCDHSLGRIHFVCAPRLPRANRSNQSPNVCEREYTPPARRMRHLSTRATSTSAQRTISIQ